LMAPIMRYDGRRFVDLRRYVALRIWQNSRTIDIRE
jgi:hypothetical protein